MLNYLTYLDFLVNPFFQFSPKAGKNHGSKQGMFERKGATVARNPLD
jgi:hypothetical protein